MNYDDAGRDICQDAAGSEPHRVRCSLVLMVYKPVRWVFIDLLGDPHNSIQVH
jgi:hypothetical protein